MASIISRNKKVVVVYSYVDEEKKRKQKWDSFSTKSEANKRKKFIEYYQAVNGSVQVPNKQDLSLKHNEAADEKLETITLSAFLEIYVSIYGKSNWSATTLRNKKSLIRNYIDPIIDEVNLDQITTRELSKYYTDLLSVKEAAANRPNYDKLLQPSNVKKFMI